QPTTAEIEATIADISGAGVKAMLTEMDIDVLPRVPGMVGAAPADKARIREATNIYPDGLPEQVQERLARRYADIFALVRRHRDELSRVTFWGVTDASSWLNNFPIPGRADHPLLWDRQGRPKPALAAVAEALRGA